MNADGNNSRLEINSGLRLTKCRGFPRTPSGLSCVPCVPLSGPIRRPVGPDRSSIGRSGRSVGLELELQVQLHAAGRQRRHRVSKKWRGNGPYVSHVIDMIEYVERI